MIREYKIAECDICGAWQRCKFQDCEVAPFMRLPDGWRFGQSLSACFCDDCSNFLSNHPKFSKYFHQ